MESTSMEFTSEDFDKIADEVFGPIYDYYAKMIIEKTGISSGRMIDIGCGGGHLGFAVMQASGLRCCFIDVRDEAIGIVNRRAAKRGLADRTEAMTADVHRIGLPDGCADLIVSRGSYQFWEEQEKAYEELYRLLAPGGYTFIGSGLGPADQRVRIKEEMSRREPDWRPPAREDHEQLSTAEYHRVFSEHGWEHEIIDGDEGRWLIIHKQKD